MKKREVVAVLVVVVLVAMLVMGCGLAANVRCYSNYPGCVETAEAIEAGGGGW